jgi:hypothetical protein
MTVPITTRVGWIHAGRHGSHGGQYDGAGGRDSNGVFGVCGAAAVGGDDGPPVRAGAAAVTAAFDEHRFVGRALQRARGTRSAAEVALCAGISLDTLRKIERGAIATPAFFTVAALANVLHLDLNDLADELTTPARLPDRLAS